MCIVFQEIPCLVFENAEIFVIQLHFLNALMNYKLASYISV